MNQNIMLGVWCVVAAVSSIIAVDTVFGLSSIEVTTDPMLWVVVAAGFITIVSIGTLVSEAVFGD